MQPTDDVGPALRRRLRLRRSTAAADMWPAEPARSGPGVRRQNMGRVAGPRGRRQRRRRCRRCRHRKQQPMCGKRRRAAGKKQGGGRNLMHSYRILSLFRSSVTTTAARSSAHLAELIDRAFSSSCGMRKCVLLALCLPLLLLGSKVRAGRSCPRDDSVCLERRYSQPSLKGSHSFSSDSSTVWWQTTEAPISNAQKGGCLTGWNCVVIYVPACNVAFMGTRNG